MSTFILIHGAWHGGWCWEKVKYILEQNGHIVLAPDLPGHGEDKTPICDISLESYVDCVCDLLDRQQEKVILVGHSLGGLTITQAAEKHPDTIEVLVYLSALLLRNGDSRHSISDSEPSGSMLAEYRELNKKEGYSTVKEQGSEKVFYNDCSDDDILWAKSKLVPQSLQPMDVPMSTSKKNFGSVRRMYIECLQDKAIIPEFQKKMYTELPCEKVITMNTSHSPFLSAPRELANHLIFLSNPTA